MKFFRKHQKTIIAILAGVMALLMILPMVANIVGVAFAAPTKAELQDQIDDLKDKSSSLAAQKKDLASQLKSIRSDKSRAMEQKMILESQADVLRDQIATSDSLIAQYDSLIAQKEVELAEAQQKEADQFDLFCERVRAMEEDGSVSYWAILFNAADFSDLLDRFAFVSEVMEYDNHVMDMLAEARQAVADAKTELEADRADQQAVREEQVAQKAELDDKLAQTDALVDKIAAKEDEYEHAMDELEAAAKEMDKLVAAKQKEYDALLAAGKITIDAGSGYQWPLNGYNTLSSLFGHRIHPVTGKPGNHTGIDIPAPKGTSIYAARGGVVTTSKMGSGSDWSYGNYVVINHGDGTSTLYAHMNSRAVKEGDVVKQGQCIGYVGTTGRSTGYHLHFEVRVNNVRVDPVDYYPNKTLYARSNGKVVKLQN